MTEEQVQPAASESDSVSEEENGELEQPATEEQPAGEVEGMGEIEKEMASLRQQLSSATQKYRALILSAAPEVPEELVKGETPDEVDASFAAAREMVDRVRRQLEAKAAAERVPAGAPARTPPDLSGLSPVEKIAYALSRTSQSP